MKKNFIENPQRQEPRTRSENDKNKKKRAVVSTPSYPRGGAETENTTQRKKNQKQIESPTDSQPTKPGWTFFIKIRCVLTITESKNNYDLSCNEGLGIGVTVNI